MIEAGTSVDASRETLKTDCSKQTIRGKGKRKRRRNRYSLINSSNCRYDLVRFTATKFSIKESLENWNIYWTDLSISVQRCKEMKRFQRINHFPGMMEICRKDLLARNLNRLYKAFPDDYNVFPRTWCLPTDMAEVSEFAKVHKGKCFIVKPDQGCQGRGIAITKNIAQLKTYDKMICQQYIQRPFLIDGYKFDLRIYVLITSCDPMRLFVYNEGLARFATAKYREPNVLNASNMYMHLTNYSVNKHSRAYNVDDLDGSKRKLSTINMWFQKNNYDVKKIWESIDDVIIKTMAVSLPTLKHYYHTCFPNHTTSHACFEILGFDFMFDYKLKPYVLEVNHSPSFNTETTIDHEVKESLLYDTFNILNLQHNNRFRVLIEDKKRARDRLFSVTHSPEILSREKAQDDRISQHRIEWENTHMGNYRKIFPGKNDEYYEKFIAAKQNAMYAETVSSKAKEVVPKAGEQGTPRNIKKLKMNSQESSSLVKTKIGDGDGVLKEKFISTEPSSSVIHDIDEFSKVTKKPVGIEQQSECSDVKSMNSDVAVVGTPTPAGIGDKATVLPAEPDHINEIDERERISNMRKRDYLVKSHGILEKVYENLKNAGLLKLETEIKVGRSNNWNVGEEACSQDYISGYQKLNKSMVQVIDCISKKVEQKETETSITGDVMIGNHCDEVTDEAQTLLVSAELSDSVCNAVEEQKTQSVSCDTNFLLPDDVLERERHHREDEKCSLASGESKLLAPKPKPGYTRLHTPLCDGQQNANVISTGLRMQITGERLKEEISQKCPMTCEVLDINTKETIHQKISVKPLEGNKSREKVSRKTPMTVEFLDNVQPKSAKKVQAKSGSDLLENSQAIDRRYMAATRQRKPNSDYNVFSGDSRRKAPDAVDIIDCTSQMRFPTKVKPKDSLPESLLRIERPFNVADHRKYKYSFEGRKYEILEDSPKTIPATVEVVTPYVRRSTEKMFERDQKPNAEPMKNTSKTPVLKISHFGKQEAWGSLEEYFEQRKMLNRSWQNTDV